MKNSTCRSVMALSLTIAMLIVLSACGLFHEHEVKEHESEIVRYIKQDVFLPFDDFIIANACVSADEIFVVGHRITSEINNTFVIVLDNNGETKKQIQCIWDDEYSHQITASTVDEYGVIWLLEDLWIYEYDENGSRTNSIFAGWWIERIDKEGFSGNILSLPSDTSPFDIAAYGNNLYIFEMSRFYVYNYQGEYLGSSEELTRLFNPSFSENGSFYVTYSSFNQDYIGEIDLQSFTISKNYTPAVTAHDVISGCDKYDLYMSDGRNLYGFECETEKVTEILNWNLSGLSGNYKGFKALGQNRFLYYSSKELCILEPSSIDSNEMVILTIGTITPNYIRDAVADFNSRNPKYAVVIKDYSQYNSKDNPNGGVEQLNLDIATGSGPDIIDLTSLPRDQYEKTGVLEDLYTRLTSDEEIKDVGLSMDFVKKISSNGHVYALIPCYSIATIFGYSSIKKTYEPLSCKDLLIIKSQMGFDQNPFGNTMSRQSFLEFMLSTSNSVFVDWDDNSCNFDNDEFIALLDFAKELPMDYDLSQDLQMINSHEQLLSVQSVGNEMTLLAFDYYFDGELELIGIPTTINSGPIIVPSIAVGISTSCKDKDGAWEFLKMFLSKKYQALYSESLITTTEYGLRMAQNSIDEWRENDGKLSLNDIYGKEVVLSADNAKADDLFYQLISSAEGAYNYNSAILNIVWEEAQAFFYGDKTAQEVSTIIQSKVSLYMGERS